MSQETTFSPADFLNDTELRRLGEGLFYPGISDNLLHFHGTNSQEKLDSILHQGLKGRTPTRPTLARRISYTGSVAYGGSPNGYILAFTPDETEIEFNPYHSNSTPIITYEALARDKIVFYFPGGSHLPGYLGREVDIAAQNLKQPQPDHLEFYQHLKDMITDTQSFLETNGIFPNQPISPALLQRFAQETVWNELCYRVCFDTQTVEYETGIIEEIRQQELPDSLEALIARYRQKYYLRDTHFDLNQLEQKYRFVTQIHTLPGIGFEGYNNPFRWSDPSKTITWLKSLPRQKELAEASSLSWLWQIFGWLGNQS
jgi:hypothetical protein